MKGLLIQLESSQFWYNILWSIDHEKIKSSLSFVSILFCFALFFLGDDIVLPCDRMRGQ